MFKVVFDNHTFNENMLPQIFRKKMLCNEVENYKIIDLPIIKLNDFEYKKNFVECLYRQKYNNPDVYFIK